MPDAPQSPAQPSRWRPLWEVLVVFFVVTLLCAVFYQLRGVVGLLRDYHQILIAALFLFVPTEILIRRGQDFGDYALTHKPLGKGLLVFMAVSLVVFPLFAGGFYLYYRQVCGLTAAGWSWLPRQIRGLCRTFVGHWSRVRFRPPPRYWEVVLGQFLVVAVPEEYFFRGYILTRLDAVWPSRRRLLGAPVGWSLVVSSVLFALGHLLVDFNGLRLAVFFPGLVFGWMRQRTGSILAGVMFHACSNLVSDALHKLFFGF